jgi:hypothetical protein
MLSRRAAKRWLLAGFALFAGSVCWLLATVHHSDRGLAYQGKRVGYWFNQLPMTRMQVVQGRDAFVQSGRKQARHIQTGAVQRYGAWVEEPEASRRAIKAIGNNGLKLYLFKLRQPQAGTFRTRMQKAAFAVGLRRFLFPDVSAEREQAVTALILLKPLPKEAERELLVMSTNSHAEIAGAARCVLIGEPGKLLLTRDADEAIRDHFEDKASWR